jgi:hypothetical protein
MPRGCRCEQRRRHRKCGLFSNYDSDIVTNKSEQTATGFGRSCSDIYNLAAYKAKQLMQRGYI